METFKIILIKNNIYIKKYCCCNKCENKLTCYFESKMLII